MRETGETRSHADQSVIPELCALPATRLSELLAAREVSSVEVTEAHLDRITRIDPKLRAYTDVFFTRARDDARRADEARARGEVRGPLHGLPVSIKECFDVAGLATTLGSPARAGRRATADAAMVTLLREAGAVVLGRTNLSQMMLFNECRNPLFGQTSNPFSEAHTPGGSSGGEAAAIAAGLSPLGIGTDIGGSIRVPAAFCGIAGLKPTLDRWPMRGIQAPMHGQEAVRATAGPMARTVGDLTLAMRAIDARRASALDGRVPPLAFDDPSALDVKSLRVGVCTHDDGLPLSPAVLRAIDRASAVLRERGVSVRTFTPPRMRDALALYFGAMSADQGKRMLEFNEDAPLDDVLRALRRIAELPSSVRRALASVLARTGDDLAAMLLRVLGEKPVSEFWKLTYAIRSYRFELLEAMDRAKVDVLLCAPHVTPAMPHGGAKDFVLAGAPAMLFNLTQLPAGVVPVTRVRPEETERPTPRGRLERRAAWVDAQSQGLPVGVQVAGRPWRDADVLAILAAIEEGVSGDAFFPKTPVAFA